MALVKNISTHPLDLTDGRIVDPSDTINADLSLPHEADLVASGRLVVTNPSTDPPAPATRNVPVVAPIAYTDPSTSVTLDISGEATDAEVAAAIAAIGGRFRGAYASLTSGAVVKANDVVTNPSGALVSRIADGTISGSYNPANWTALSAGSGGSGSGLAFGDEQSYTFSGADAAEEGSWWGDGPPLVHFMPWTPTVSGRMALLLGNDPDDPNYGNLRITIFREDHPDLTPADANWAGWSVNASDGGEHVDIDAGQLYTVALQDYSGVAGHAINLNGLLTSLAGFGGIVATPPPPPANAALEVVFVDGELRGRAVATPLKLFPGRSGSLPWDGLNVGGTINAQAVEPAGSLPWFVAVDDTYLYWSTRGSTIGRALLDGSFPEHEFIAAAGSALEGLAIDDTHIYWIDNGGGKIRRALKSDGTSPTDLLTDVPNPGGLAVDDSHLYWGNASGTIGRADLDGSNPNASFVVSGGPNLEGIAVTADHIYWSDPDSHTIGRADIDGTNINNAFIAATVAGQSGPYPWDIKIVAVDDEYIDGIYWAARKQIGRANIDGTNVRPTWLKGDALALFTSVAISPDWYQVYWADGSSSGATGNGAVGLASL